MIRTIALVALALHLTGCAQYQSREGPFWSPPKQPPPPYGSTPRVAGNLSAPRPIGNQSPLGIAAPDSSTLAPTPSEPSLTPTKPAGPAPASAVVPDIDPELNDGFPPFRRRGQSRNDSPPSPSAPKDAPNAPKAAPKADTPDGPSPAAKNLGELKALLATATAAWKAVDTYEATLTRREVNPNRDVNPKGELTSELVLLQFRREPMSVFMRTIGESGKGREIVYNPAKHNEKMYVMLGEGDNRIMKAGFIAPPISPDDPRVKEKARYSIREAGYYRHINSLNAAVAKLEAGRVPADAVVFQGYVKRPEYPYALAGVAYKIRPGDEPAMPNGGTRLHFFDMKKDSPSYGVPVLVAATDAAGKEVEYYLIEKMMSPAGLTDADFDPARLGKRK